jgi:hypothetical protein
MNLYLDTWISLGFVALALIFYGMMHLMSKSDAPWGQGALAGALSLGLFIYGLSWLF